MRSGIDGIFAPKGTPKKIIAKLAAALDKALDDPSVRKRLGDLGGSVPANHGGGAAIPERARRRHKGGEKARAPTSDHQRFVSSPMLMADNKNSPALATKPACLTSTLR
jgi:Tripartite tricarboxylate transporter family receptor